MEREEISPQEMSGALEHQSGLLALAGTADMREIVERAANDDESEVGRRARLALDVYVHRLRAGIAAMAAALGGLDVLVFTGGVGERSAAVRERTAAGLGFLGVELDGARNEAAQSDAEIGADGDGDDDDVSTLVITAREDLEIARQVRAALRKK
jgi:acetate kinase